MFKIFKEFLKDFIFSLSLLFYRLFKYDPNKKEDFDRKLIILKEEIKIRKIRKEKGNHD